MATPRKVHLTVEDTGIVKFKPQDAETAAKTSELLQENHEKHHIFFNRDGFHNHISHHLLSLYGLGAPASIIEKRYKENTSYQRDALPVDERIVQDMTNPDHFSKYLGKEEYYSSYLTFFQNEMEDKGWEKVLSEYLFAGDARADDLLGRLYAGFLHPLIHLGFGIEFNQPAIMAEAVAEACVHDKWTGDYLRKAEKAAKSHGTQSTKTFLELLGEIRADKKLSNAADWSDGNKIRDGILVRAPEEMLKYATQWVVTAETLEEKTAEMTNSDIYFTATAQHPPKQVKFDFYFMHCVNCSIFFPSINSLSFIPLATKVRLLRWKGYLDLAMYASRHSPPLLKDEVTSYIPKKVGAGKSDWKGIFQRLWDFQDDGHAIKLGRAVKNGELITKKWEEKGWATLQGDMWEKVGNMVIDSVEDTGNHWARSVGFEEAWADYVDRPAQARI